MLWINDLNVHDLLSAFLTQIKLADKQAALERLQWEAMNSNTQVERLQEEVNTMQAEMSSFTLLCEGLTEKDGTFSTEDDDDATLYNVSEIVSY